MDIIRLQMLSWFLVLSLLGNWSCSSGSEPLFTMTMEVDFTIPPGLNNFDTHYFVLRGIPTFYRNYVNSNNEVAIGQINASRALMRARFETADWGIFQEVAVDVGLSDAAEGFKEVFYQDVIRFSGVEELRLFSSLSEVKDILSQELVTIQVRLNLRRITSREINTRLTMNFVAYGPE